MRIKNFKKIKKREREKEKQQEMKTFKIRYFSIASPVNKCALSTFKEDENDNGDEMSPTTNLPTDSHLLAYTRLHENPIAVHCRWLLHSVAGQRWIKVELARGRENYYNGNQGIELVSSPQ